MIDSVVHAMNLAARIPEVMLVLRDMEKRDSHSGAQGVIDLLNGDGA